MISKIFSSPYMESTALETMLENIFFCKIKSSFYWLNSVTRKDHSYYDEFFIDDVREAEASPSSPSGLF